MSLQELREEGNKHFNSGDYKTAISSYTKAINLCKGAESEAAIFYRNRAAAYLKLGQHKNAVNDATKALNEDPSDVKALFRRCQALEHLKRYDDAFRDAKTIHHLEPQNSAIQPVLRRLSIKLQEAAKQECSTLNQVTKMLTLATNEGNDLEKTIQAVNNLIVLARENAGIEVIMKENGVSKLLAVVKRERNAELCVAFIRVLGELCRSSADRSIVILNHVGMTFFVDALNCNSEQQIYAVQYAIQTIICALTGMDMKESKKPDESQLAANQVIIDNIMTVIVKSSASRAMSALGRDALLEVIMKNVDLNSLNWGTKLVDTDGLHSLLEIASELKEIRHESSMDITANTRPNISVALDKVYSCMDHDKAREKYRDRVMVFVNDKLKGPDIENKVRVTAVITALLLGPLEVGNYCLGQPGVVEMMLVMAGSDDEVQQRVAAEAIVAAASKKDKCSSIIATGMGILKKLFQSQNDSIRVRALVGLCKLGSMGGTDASLRPFSDSSTEKLAIACHKFLTNPAKDKDLRKWAAEGLAYLTLDADIKEGLIDDRPALSSLIELAKTGDLSVLYGVVATLVNLTNSYDKQELLPELVELAKYGKQHVPEEHPKDAKEYLERRIKVLVESGVTSALVMLSKTESRNSRELISRVFNAVCEYVELRGTVVQQGGTKALLDLARNDTDTGKIMAAQALARLGITINPEVAFPGQRCEEIVRPLMTLLHPDCNALQNFEALMALTNLASVSNSVRERMLTDCGLSKIEHYMYEEHTMLKRAAFQCLVNLVCNDNVITVFENMPDRVKYLLLMTEEEDTETALAAAGALAILTSTSKKACEHIFEAKDWVELLGKLLTTDDPGLQHRGTCIVRNVIDSDSSLAEKVVETNLLEALMVVAGPEAGDSNDKVKLYARQALQRAQDWKLIRSAEAPSAEE